jgi:hypothetical protein
MAYEGSVFEKLIDPTLFTGTHKHRFDAFGRGKGLHGRREAYELLDAGVLFESNRSATHGGGCGDAADRAEALWMKSLRAAIHSPSLAKQLQTAGYPHGGAAASKSTTSLEEDVHDSNQRPMIQAWVLDDDGRLVYDDQRTRRLLEEDISDANRIQAMDSSAAGEPHSHRPENLRTERTLNPHSHQEVGHVKRTSHRPDERTTNIRLQRRAPADVHNKHSAVTRHMRRLLYEDDDPSVGAPNSGMSWDRTAGAETNESWMRTIGSSSVAHSRRSALPYVVGVPDGHDDDDVAPQEQFRRWDTDGASGGDGGPSLEETLAMLSEYDDDVEGGGRSPRRTYGSLVQHRW